MTSTLLPKVTLMLALVAATFAAFLVIARDQTLLQTHYYAAIIDKQAWLEEAPSPKIVFVGGSNLAFGLDSVAVGQGLCRPVVNMGLHALIGLRLPLSAIRPFIHRGDIVVLSPEYQMFWGLYDGSGALSWALYFDPTLARYLDSPGEYWAMLSTFPSFMQDLLAARRQIARAGIPPVSIYDRRAINRNGDFIGHLGEPGIDISQLPLSLIRNSEIDGAAVASLNDFYSYALAEGVETLFIYPAVPEKQFLENRAELELLHAYLSAHLKARILTTPADAVLPVADFFDTVYHLNAAGRQLRAQWLVERMLPIVSQSRADGLANCK